MSADSIKDFLVSLGFEVDKDGMKKFNDVLKDSEKLALKFGKAMVNMAVDTVGAVTVAANSLEKLYYSSQRIGASAANITAYQATIANMGGTAEAAAGSLEELARKMRNSPGYEGMLQGMGVATRTQNGAMRDRVEVMKDLGKALAAMPTSRANAYANALGLDENTMLAMRDPAFTGNLERIQKLRQQMGMSDDLAKSGQQFSAEYRELTTNIKTIVEVIVMTAGKKLIPMFHMLNAGMETLVKWFSMINPDVKHFLANVLGWAAAGIVLLGIISMVAALYRTFKLFKEVIGILNAVKLVMKALNLTFLANPIVLAITAIIAAMYLLWDDFQTWKSGGKSLLPWGSITDGAKGLVDVIKDVISHLAKLGEIVNAVFHGDFKKAAEIAKEVMGEVVEAAKPVIKHIEQAAPKVIQQATDAATVTAQFAGAIATQGFDRVKNFAKGSGWSKKTSSALFGEISEASKRYGISEAYLKTIAYIESKGDTNAKSSTGATGIYQFTRGTGKQYGLIKNGVDMRNNEAMNVDAAAHLAQDNMKALGGNAAPWMLYMAHQQGTGMLSILLDALRNHKSTSNDMRLSMDRNLPKKLQGASIEKFLDFWKSTYDAGAVASGASMPYRDIKNIASGSAGDVKTVSVSSETTINVNGVDNPSATANQVARTQQNSNAVLARNVGNVVR